MARLYVLCVTQLARYVRHSSCADGTGGAAWRAIRHAKVRLERPHSFTSAPCLPCHRGSPGQCYGLNSARTCPGDAYVSPRVPGSMPCDPGAAGVVDLRGLGKGGFSRVFRVFSESIFHSEFCLSDAARRAGLRRPRCCSSRKNRHAHARRAHPALLLAARCEEQPAAHGPPAFASFGPLPSGGGGRTLMVSRIDGRRGCTCSFKQTGAQLRCTARLVNHSLFRARAGGASRRHDRRRLLSASRTFRVSGGD